MKNYKNIIALLFLCLSSSNLSALIRCQSAPVGRVKESFDSLFTTPVSTIFDVDSENWFDSFSGTDYPDDNSFVCLNFNLFKDLPVELLETYYKNVFILFYLMNNKGFNIEQDLSNDDYMIRWNVNFDKVLIEIIFPFTFPFEVPFVRVISPKLKNTMNISDFGAILHSIVTPIEWNMNMNFNDFLLVIKEIVSPEVISIDEATDNYYCEEKARCDFRLYLSRLGFN